MRTVGIIAEYNPFHTGHEYHIQKAKEVSEADYAIVVMSPDFVQRGEPAIFDKYTRARMALLGGADLVIELPVCYATGSAEYFAEGAVTMMNALGVVDTLCFGGESDDVSLFQQTADVLMQEPEEYVKMLRELLKQGKTYPQARSEALGRYLNVFHPIKQSLAAGFTEPAASNAELNDFLAAPNNILGIEYCKALRKLNSKITPLPIKRQSSDYNSSILDGAFCSATAIRNTLSNDKSNQKMVLQYIPQTCHELFTAASAHTLASDDFLPFLNQKLLFLDSFSSISDISSDLSDRIKSNRFECINKSYEQIIAHLKTKQVTEARIRRALLHLILNIESDTVEAFRINGTVFYARVLGFRKSASPLLHELKQKTLIPFAVKTSAAEKDLSGLALKMWKLDFYASHLYRSVHVSKNKLPFKTEYEYSPVIQ